MKCTLCHKFGCTYVSGQAEGWPKPKVLIIGPANTLQHKSLLCHRLECNNVLCTRRMLLQHEVHFATDLSATTSYVLEGWYCSMKVCFATDLSATKSYVLEGWYCCMKDCFATDLSATTFYVLEGWYCSTKVTCSMDFTFVTYC